MPEGRFYYITGFEGLSKKLKKLKFIERGRGWMFGALRVFLWIVDTVYICYYRGNTFSGGKR
jgi:hypothetical protein